MEKPWKVIAAFAGVFVAGSVFGGLLVLRFSGSDQSMSTPAVPVAGSPATQPPVATPPAITATQRPAGQPNQPPPPQLQLPPGMAAQTPQIMKRYVERLDLTAEQKERVNPLIQRATADLRRQQQNNFRETGVIIQHLQEDIAKELTPVQRKRIEEMAERQRELLEKRVIQEQLRLQQEKEKQKAAKPAQKDGKPAAKKPVDDGQ